MEGKTQKTKGNNVGSVIASIVLIIAIIVAIVCSYTAFVTKAGNGVPSIFGIRPFSVQTDSMAPTFNKGDLIIDKVVDPAALQVGDIITFWTVINGYRVLNTHRIVSITDAGNYLYFETKGDANPVADATGVHQSEIVGKYQTHIPKVGAFIDFLQTSKGFFICIVVPVAIFFIFELIVFIKNLMAYNEEKMKRQFIEEQKKANGDVTPDAEEKDGVAGSASEAAAETEKVTATEKTESEEKAAILEAAKAAAAEELKKEQEKAALFEAAKAAALEELRKEQAGKAEEENK